jgi:hypothetical protein
VKILIRNPKMMFPDLDPDQNNKKNQMRIHIISTFHNQCKWARAMESSLYCRALIILWRKIKVLLKLEPLISFSTELWFLKGIDRPFGGGVESILIRSLLLNWRLGKSRWLVKVTLLGFLFFVKWLYAVTSTPYHECTRSHQLRKMNVRSFLTP